MELTKFDVKISFSLFTTGEGEELENSLKGLDTSFLVSEIFPTLESLPENVNVDYTKKKVKASIEEATTIDA